MLNKQTKNIEDDTRTAFNEVEAIEYMLKDAEANASEKRLRHLQAYKILINLYKKRCVMLESELAEIKELKK